MKRRHRMSGRLLLLFLLTAFLLAMVVRTGFRFGVEGSFQDVAGPHLDEFSICCPSWETRPPQNVPPRLRSAYPFRFTCWGPSPGHRRVGLRNLRRAHRTPGHWPTGHQSSWGEVEKDSS